VPQLESRPSKLLKLTEQEDDEEGSDDESKSSSIQTEDLDLRFLAGEAIVQQMSYFRQGSAISGKFHVISSLDTYDNGRPTPWCRSKPFAQDPMGGVHEDLQGIPDPSRVCERCLQRMPNAEKEIVRQFLFPEEKV